jgi:hypothetical protein
MEDNIVHIIACSHEIERSFQLLPASLSRPRSNLNAETNFPDWNFSISSVPSDKYRDRTSDYTMTTSFHELSYLSRYSDGRTTRVRFPAGARYFFLLSITSKTALGRTQIPTQWVRRLFPREESGRAVKLTTLLHLLPASRMVELYLHSPTRLHSIVLN